jgi:hypothetical protein
MKNSKNTPDRGAKIMLTFVNLFAKLLCKISPTFAALYTAKIKGANSTVSTGENVVVVLKREAE